MLTVFAKICTAVIDLLQANQPVCDHIYRSRARAIPQAWKDVVGVRVHEAEFEPFTIYGAPINTDTSLVIECVSRSADLEPDLAVDELVAKVRERIASDATLGGLVLDCELRRLTFNPMSDDENIGSAQLIFVVRHQVSANSLE